MSVNVTIECPDCELPFTLEKEVAVVYCPHCDGAMKNPLHEGHEDASDRDIKTAEAFRKNMTTPPEFDWREWQTKRYKKD